MFSLITGPTDFSVSTLYAGLILDVTKCLTEVYIWGQEQPSLLPLTTHLVTCCCQVIDSMLEVMASVAGQGRCLLPLTTHLVTCCCQVIDSMLEVMASVAGQGRCLLPLTTHLVTCCCQVTDSMLEVMASVAGQGRCYR